MGIWGGGVADEVKVEEERAGDMAGEEGGVTGAVLGIIG